MVEDAKDDSKSMDLQKKFEKKQMQEIEQKVQSHFPNSHP